MPAARPGSSTLLLPLAPLSRPRPAAPYGIESFDDVLEPLWKGIRLLRGKVLAAFLKAIGFVIPLMDAMYANYYTREVMIILIRCGMERCMAHGEAVLALNLVPLTVLALGGGGVRARM